MEQNKKLEEYYSIGEAPKLKFSPPRDKSCNTCSHDPTYLEQKELLISCKAVGECVNLSLWKKKKFKRLQL